MVTEGPSHKQQFEGGEPCGSLKHLLDKQNRDGEEEIQIPSLLIDGSQQEPL